MKRTRHNLGFTILELVLVLMIMAIVLAIAAPSLQAWRAGSQLRYCAEDVVSATHWARSRAISEARTYVLAIDRQNAAFGLRVMDGQNLTNVDGEFSQPLTIPAGGHLDAVDPSRQALNTIHFYPTGRVDAATIRISDSRGETAVIEATAPSDDFVITGQGMNR